MALSTAEKIAALKDKKKRADERLREAIAKAEEQERRRLARRKTVIGTAILAAIENDDSLADLVSLALAMHVTAPADRETVADLLARTEKTNGASAASGHGSKAA